MSQARITLRPPPNVDFVEGYPGIPAGPDRPHAEVRGTIEVRLPDQGAKAKWVRVELRKVETLPGGGQPNKFDDFIGQSPVKIWDAEGAWSLLHSHDFTFAIRIPESIPPTIKLDRGAGIRYELTATICLKGKSFFFKKKDTTLSTTHPIIIDKHELHSTWPVYAQPESRHVVEDLLMLTVDRSHTCYGPGDMVKVLATFKNDGIPAAALRGFELLLKETIIYRAGPHASGKKRAPQVHVTPIGEQKINVNMTLYQGQQYQTELGCFIPQTHTNTTVVAARHIDISYKIEVKAVLGTGKPLIMELPVTVSNWPRNMSIEAVRRIGPAPNLSLVSPINTTRPMAAATIGATRPTTQPQTTQQSTYDTAPARSGLYSLQKQLANERLTSQSMSATSSQYGDPVTGPRSNYDEFGLSAVAGPPHSAVPRGASPAIIAEHSGTGMRRPPVNTNPSRRLTLTNAEAESDPDSPPSVLPASSRQNDATSDDRRRVTPGAVSGPSAPVVNGRPSSPRTTAPQRSAWPTAEQEKQRLYNQAREQALRTQASMGYKPTMPDGPELLSRQDSLRTSPSMPVPEPAPAPVTKSTEPKRSTPWPTAEEEKLRLYQEAERSRLRTQAQVLSEGYVPGGSGVNGGAPLARSYSIEHPELTHKANLSSSSMSHDGAVYPPVKPTQPMEAKSTGVQLYQHAIASMNRKPSLQASSQAANPPSPPAPKPGSSQRSYPTAEEEKAALRYYEAKRAVDRHQQVNAMDPLHIPSSAPPTEGPIAYEDLYPAGVSSAQAGSSYAVNGRISDVSNDDNVPPPPISPLQASSSMFESAMSEKERLRRKYEAEDAAASAAAAAPPTPPSRVSGSRSSPPEYGSPPRSTRSQPLPPADYSGPRFMTAAEEKARLRARMEAEEAAEGGAPSGSNAAPGPSRPSAPATRKPSLSLSYAHHERIEEEDVPPPLPPPLAPRPPAEYIEQTKEEDLRSQAEHRDILPSVDSELSMSSSSASDQKAAATGAATTTTTGVDFGLPFRPFSPFDLNVNFDSDGSRRAQSVLPPPLPPKVPVSQ